MTEVNGATLPVLVDFWAEWCSPCRALAPTLEALQKEFSGKLKIVKVNVDQNPELATQFNVRTIPTLLLFKGGKIEQQLVGNMPQSTLKAKIEPYLG
jgi:thioredoxin 1